MVLVGLALVAAFVNVPARDWRLSRTRHAPPVLCTPTPPDEAVVPNAIEVGTYSGLPTDLGPLPPVGETLRQLDPDSVGVVSLDLDQRIQVPLVDPKSTFVGLFLECTPYIKMHQDSTMVIHVASEVLDKPELFELLMEEVAVLALLGVRPVLLVGVRMQVDASLRRRNGNPVLYKGDGDVRETDEETMRVVQEVCGFMRSRVEGALSRGRARSGPSGGVGVDVVGGNFFYTAQPVGVRNGKDYGYTGEVRSIDVPKINKHLNAGEIVLMTALGYSASGAIFNVKTEQVAAAAASALSASKLIYMTPDRLVGCRSNIASCAVEGADRMSTQISADQPLEDGEGPPVLQSMRLAEAKSLIKYYAQICPPPPAPARQADDAPAGEVCATAVPPTLDDAQASGVKLAEASAATADEATPEELADYATRRCLQLCRHCVRALELGVTRTHILPPAPGALIQELYTTDGIGTLITRDVYDGIRLAAAEDIPNILTLIEPLETRGVLVKRAPEVLARDVDSGYYYVYTRDDTLLACAQLKRYSATHAELACLVVAPSYRRQGCGDAMLGFMERTAVAAGVNNLFALSTHTMQWFMERGFRQVSVDELPERRAAIYDSDRASKVYVSPCARTSLSALA